MAKRMSIHLPSHVAMTVEELAARAHVSQAEIVRWSVLTFTEAVGTDLEIGYLGLFRESETVQSNPRWTQTVDAEGYVNYEIAKGQDNG